jgi:hypothetical protein
VGFVARMPAAGGVNLKADPKEAVTDLCGTSPPTAGSRALFARALPARLHSTTVQPRA